MKLGRWAAIDSCDSCDQCNKIPTHVVFFNTPDDKPFVVRTCRKHLPPKNEWPSVTLHKFKAVVDKLLKAGVTERHNDLAWAVWEEFNPALVAQVKAEMQEEDKE